MIRRKISTDDEVLRPIWAEPRLVGMHRPLTTRQPAVQCLPEMQTQQMRGHIVDTEETNGEVTVYSARCDDEASAVSRPHNSLCAAAIATTPIHSLVERQ